MYTIVIGLDEKTHEQALLTIPTWKRHKPEIFDNPWVIFYDGEISKYYKLMKLIECSRIAWVNWPPNGVTYEGDEKNKWTNPQRGKMLSGFVHVAAQTVNTDFWLKLDVDVLASPGVYNLDWKTVIPNPSDLILAPGWGYTKPANQIVMLDNWVQKHTGVLSDLSIFDPLDIKPLHPESALVKHPRICSWCAFFNTKFTKYCSDIAEKTCGKGKLPVSSQDGYMWYVAKRMKGKISIFNPRMYGWSVRGSLKSIKESLVQITE